MVGTQQKVMGVGCFAAEATLSRVLRKMVAAYSLGDWRAAMANEESSSEGCRLLRRLISGIPASGGVNSDGNAGETIAGFFLAFENQRLNLSVFTRRGGWECRKYTAPMDAFTRLRQKRLH